MGDNNHPRSGERNWEVGAKVVNAEKVKRVIGIYPVVLKESLDMMLGLLLGEMAKR